MVVAGARGGGSSTVFPDCCVMKIKINRHRTQAMILWCVVIVLALLVGGFIIYHIIKFCRTHLGPPPPGGTNTNYNTFVVFPTSPEPVPAAVIEQARSLARQPGGCEGLSVLLKAPEALPDGWRIFVERSTNLVNWDIIAETVPDETQTCQTCDMDPPWPNAFYRLRALPPAP